jgi:hypothetical protein
MDFGGSDTDRKKGKYCQHRQGDDPGTGAKPVHVQHGKYQGSDDAQEQKHDVSPKFPRRSGCSIRPRPKQSGNAANAEEPGKQGQEAGRIGAE